MPIAARSFPRPASLKNIAVGDLVVRSSDGRDTLALRVQVADDAGWMLVLAEITHDNRLEPTAPYLSRADAGVHCRIVEPVVARPRARLPVAILSDPPEGALTISEDGRALIRFRMSPNRAQACYADLSSGKVELLEGHRVFYRDWDLCRWDGEGETLLVSFPATRPDIARAVA